MLFCSRHITEVLNEMALKLSGAEDFSKVSLLTANYHVYPDFHGNRSPLGDPELKGMVEKHFILAYILSFKLLNLIT